MKNIINKINWQKVNGLIPAIIQDIDSNCVLMLGYMNREALDQTLKTENVWFYSRTRQKLWQKGENSGNILKFESMELDCDNDTLLVKVKAPVNTCHLDRYSCFKGEKLKGFNKLDELFALVKSRKELLPEDSYTVKLFDEGLNKICVKVAEEFGEVIKAATKETKQRLIEESVDLIYHLFVLLVEKDIQIKDIEIEIQKRSLGK